MKEPRSKEEIEKRIEIYEQLRRLCKKLKYQPSQYWYQAKIEALLWVLRIPHARLYFTEWEEKRNESKTILARIRTNM